MTMATSISNDVLAGAAPASPHPATRTGKGDIKAIPAALKSEWIKRGIVSSSRLPPYVPLCATAARTGSLTRQPLAGVVDQCASR